ncbi:MAG: hypothetical protein LBR17_01245 [Bacteroidales bacterium]|jgi:hypothetical protein|nr:hypothetical protein [Bacteroidales bacterium]
MRVIKFTGYNEAGLHLFTTYEDISNVKDSVTYQRDRLRGLKADYRQVETIDISYLEEISHVRVFDLNEIKL